MNMNLCKLKDFHFAKFCLLFKKLSLSLQFCLLLRENKLRSLQFCAVRRQKERI